SSPLSSPLPSPTLPSPPLLSSPPLSSFLPSPSSLLLLFPSLLSAAPPLSPSLPPSFPRALLPLCPFLFLLGPLVLPLLSSLTPSICPLSFSLILSTPPHAPLPFHLSLFSIPLSLYPPPSLSLLLLSS